MAAKRTYKRAANGKFATAAGSGSSSAKKAKPKKRSLSAKKQLAAGKSGTIKAKGFSKTYGVKKRKIKGGSVRTTTRRSVRRLKNGKTRTIAVTRRAVTRNGRTTISRTVARTGRKKRSSTSVQFGK